MIPINYVLSYNCWHGNFIILTDKHKFISAYMTIFSMVVCAFLFLYHIFSLRWYLSIVQYVSGNVLISNFFAQYISAMYSLVMLLSSKSELINDSLLKSYDASLSDPFIYFISGPYSSNMRFQRSTLSVVKFSNVRFLWSVYTVIWSPKIIVRKYFNFSTILNSYLSVVV